MPSSAVEIANKENKESQPLPAKAKQHLKALKKIQHELCKIQAIRAAKIAQVDKDLEKDMNVVLERRRQIICNEHEPTEKDCDFPSDDEENCSYPEVIFRQSGDGPALPDFWLEALRNSDFGDYIMPQDEEVLRSLKDIQVENLVNPYGFILKFHFGENDYFTDKLLTKTYHTTTDICNEQVIFDNLRVTKVSGSTINWRPNKNLCKTVKTKVQRNKKTKETRTIEQEEDSDSFFRFFQDLPVPSDPDAEDEETLELLEVIDADLTYATEIKEMVIPNATLYYTGEISADDDYDGFDDEDGEDEEEEEEEDEE